MFIDLIMLGKPRTNYFEVTGSRPLVAKDIIRYVQLGNSQSNLSLLS